MDQHSDPPAPPNSDTISNPSQVLFSNQEIPGGPLIAVDRRAATKITRACDRCRKKKIKCDWETPICGPCTKYKETCVYSPSNRAKRRGKASNRAAQLETRLLRMEEILKTKGLPSELAESPENADKMIITPVESGSFKDCTNEEGGLALAISETDRFNQSFSMEGNQQIELPDPFVSSMVTEWPFEAGTPDSNQQISAPSPFDIPQLPGYMEIPPKFEAKSLVKLYFSHLNRMWPLFSESLFMEAFDDLYVPGSRGYQNPAAWCSIHVVLALASCVYCMTKSGTVYDYRKTMIHLKHALSLSSEILMNGSDLLSVQALLGVAGILQGTSNPRSYSILTAASARLAFILGLHHEVDGDSNLSPVEIEQRKRVFWVLNILDKDISLRSRIPPLINLDDVDISFPQDCSSDSSIHLYVGGEQEAIDILRLRIELSLISGSVYKSLYSFQARKQSEASRASAVQNLDGMLLEWRKGVCPTVPLCELARGLDGISRIQLVSLYASYFYLLTMVHRSPSTDKFNTEKSMASNQRFDPLQYGPHMSCVTAASEFMLLINALPHCDYGHLWLALYSAVSAVITLLHHVLHNPHHPDCASFTQSVDAMINALPFLTRTCEDPGLFKDIIRMHTFCIELRRRSKQSMQTYQKLAESCISTVNWGMS